MGARLDRGRLVDAGHPIASDHVAREEIRDSERVAIARIAEPELAFVVRAPDLVGSYCLPKAIRAQLRKAPASPALDQPAFLQRILQRARRRKRHPAISL